MYCLWILVSEFLKQKSTGHKHNKNWTPWDVPSTISGLQLVGSLDKLKQLGATIQLRTTDTK